MAQCGEGERWEKVGEVGGGVCVCVAFAFAFVASFVWHEKLRMPHEMTAVKLPATGTCRLWLQRKKRVGKGERKGKEKEKGEASSTWIDTLGDPLTPAAAASAAVGII